MIMGTVATHSQSTVSAWLSAMPRASLATLFAVSGAPTRSSLVGCGFGSWGSRRGRSDREAGEIREPLDLSQMLQPAGRCRSQRDNDLVTFIDQELNEAGAKGFHTASAGRDDTDARHWIARQRSAKPSRSEVFRDCCKE